MKDLAANPNFKGKNLEARKDISFFNNLDSLSSNRAKAEESLAFHSKFKKLDKILFNLLIISSITLSFFLLIIGASVISKTLGIKNKVTEYGKMGLMNIEEAGINFLNLDTKQAKYNIEEAERNITNAETELRKIKPITASLSFIPVASGYQKNATNILSIGKNIVEIGKNITNISFLLSNQKIDKLALKSEITENYSSIKNEFDNIERSLAKINMKLLDSEYKEKLEKIKTYFPLIKKYVYFGQDIITQIPEMAGFWQEKNYLLLLQNNNELRSTGGFIGSFGILKTNRGEIKEFFIDDVYKLDDPYSQAVKEEKTPRIDPPYPMNPEYTGNWALRDANINPDFEKASLDILSFYAEEVKFAKSSKYPKEINGIIAINTSFFEDIIKVLGPLEVPEYSLQLTEKNILESLQLEVESGKDKINNKNPKQILDIVKDKIIEKMSHLKSEQKTAIFQALINGLDKRNILLYSKLPNVQKTLSSLDWSGKIKKISDNEDFLMVINNNFGGGKSSLFIDETIKQEVFLNNNGDIEKELSITRTHASDYVYRYYDPWTKENKWLVGRNNNYIKIYVPKGSKLIRATGFDKKLDTFSEKESFAFGGTFSVNPLESKTITLRYKLPFKIQNSYSLSVQKQPGAPDSIMETKIILPSGYKYERSGNLKEKDILNTDRSLIIQIKK